MFLTRIALSLLDIEMFDPSMAGLIIGQGRGEQRALCPLCGQSKPRDASHRCLSLNRATGVWRCHRCGEGGKVKEAWQERVPLAPREKARRNLAQVFDATSKVQIQGASSKLLIERQKGEGWRGELRSLRLLRGTRGAAYLNGRGLSVQKAQAAGARFCLDFMGHPAVVFPLRDQIGQLHGAHARYVDGFDRPKARTLGDKKNAFFVTNNALDVTLPGVIVTEAPLDALSLAETGYPAIALCGTQPPHCMHRVCAFRRVFIAFDADDAGDRAAEKLIPELTMFGAKCERLRPDGFKDWNEFLVAGTDALSDWLAGKIL